MKKINIRISMKKSFKRPVLTYVFKQTSVSKQLNGVLTNSKKQKKENGYYLVLVYSFALLVFKDVLMKNVVYFTGLTYQISDLIMFIKHMLKNLFPPAFKHIVFLLPRIL